MIIRCKNCVRKCGKKVSSLVQQYFWTGSIKDMMDYGLLRTSPSGGNWEIDSSEMY
jgi:hypothetical protein